MSEQLEQSALAALTTEIVSAYVAHHEVHVSDMPRLIGSVASKLAVLEAEAAQAAAKAQEPRPAVPVRRSIGKDHIVCLVCGGKRQLLKRHLAKIHALTPTEYREMFSLKNDYPMTAPSYVARRAEIAIRIGLGGPRKKTSRRNG